MPLGELGEQNDDRATNNQIQGLEDPVSNVTEADKRSLGDEIQIDNSCQHQDLDVLRSDQTELILANPTLRRNDDLNGSADCTFFEEISQNEDNPTAVGLETNEHGMTITGIGPVCNPMDVTFPQTSERSAMLWGMDSLKLRWSRKQGAKLVKKDQYELFLKQRCDVLEKERRMDQMKIGSLTQELKHLGQEIQQIQHDLEREKREFGLNVTTLELELNKTKQIASEAKSRLRECEEQRDNRLRENDKLSRSISHLRRANQSVIEEAQRDLKTADDKHAIEVSRLNEEHARSIIQLEQDKKSMAAKAEKDLEMMNDKHAAEISRLNEDRKRAINALTSKLQNEMSIKTQQLQAMIDEKSRVITAQDLRMASYNKQIHSVIADGDLGQRFRALCLKIDNLINAMPRPQEYTVDAALDPTDFMGRNSSRRSRIWHKFLCKVCWDVLIRGFFHRQPGFGSFGWQGDGYLTLLQLYRLFAKSNAQDPSDPKDNFPNNRIANSWRASLFEAILNEVTSTVNDDTATGFAAFFRGNVKTVTNDLKETLQKSCKGVLDSRCFGIISKLCNEVGILSLQIGAQQSVIILETCQHKDWIRSRAGFKDDNHYNENGLQVDIMIQPSLKRIGDGGQDLTTERVLAIGDIVSLNAGI